MKAHQQTTEQVLLSNVVGAFHLLDMATTSFQTEMFKLATKGKHASDCSFIIGGTACSCYKALIPKAIKQLILGRMLSDAQFETKDPNQMEFNNDNT